MKKTSLLILVLLLTVMIAISSGCSMPASPSQNASSSSTELQMVDSITGNLPQKGSVTPLNIGDSYSTDNISFTAVNLYKGTSYASAKYQSSPYYTNKEGCTYIVLYCDCSVNTPLDKYLNEYSLAKLYFGDVDSDAVDADIKYDTPESGFTSKNNDKEATVQGLAVIAEVEDSLLEKYKDKKMRLKFGFNQGSESSYIKDFTEIDYAFEMAIDPNNEGVNKMSNYIATKPKIAKLGSSISSGSVEFSLQSFIITQKITPAADPDGYGHNAIDDHSILALFGVFKNGTSEELDYSSLYANYYFPDGSTERAYIYFDNQSISSTIAPGANLYYYIIADVPNETIQAGGAFTLSLGFNDNFAGECKTDIVAPNYYLINANISDGVISDDTNTDKMEKVEEKKKSIFEELEAAFKDNSVDVTIDASTGEVTMDSAVLFDSNSSDISSDGKDLLKNFLKAYTSVIFKDENKDYISDILVAGHTDPLGSYEDNQKLSQERADNVMDFCLSGDNGLSGDETKQLKEIMSAKGYSSDNPVYNEDGTVNNDKSRRVTFLVTIKDK